ncbi:kinase-like protein [Aaosphaeria arxii CBS 175.79]|uniref:Kinase-like protein n=1 Tax=Aaosphaeria arxii CBS 175.79 TaxID=1450172 RepID=A0A6A5XBQ5_9PLEO|nr:kinase-like protein [Aaosphaeria arxii CBS 175.79]KAF2010402.1 kinase-like protein [Aaosphaeria arxii CBS 175.79]
MQQTSHVPWRLSSAQGSEYPKQQFSLSHTMSMVNLHEEPTWYANRGPSSPTASSVSSTTSRSITPTTSNNPWSNLMASPGSTNSVSSVNSASSSPRDSPNRTPQYTSRSTTPTPIAPQPLRPINPAAGFIPMSPTTSSSAGDSFRGDFPGSPVSNFPGSPNPYRQTGTVFQQSAPAFQPLVNGFINTSVLSQGQSLSGWFYETSRRQGWDPALVKKVWQWTLSNPRLALLLVVCDDISSWRQAAFFDLRDESLPFPEDRLQGIVTNPQKVVEEQWRATSKELPLKGGHVDFTNRETVPLKHVSLVRTSRSSDKSTDLVRVLGEDGDRVLVRKRFVLTRPSQKIALLKQISDYKQFDHKNIGKLLCSYAQPSHIGVLTVQSQYSLDDYLSVPQGDPNRSKLLVDWMHDLSGALEYLHTQQVPVYHRNIRPRKILIDGSRIYLAPFGIGSNGETFSPTAINRQRLDQLNSYFQDQAFVYAAPEAIVSHGKRPADVFSLGCVFLSMMTVALNQSLSIFTQYRAGSSQDASFHAHLDRVGSWRNRLFATVTSGLRSGLLGQGRKVRQLKAESNWLQIIEKMITAKPKERIKMAELVSILAQLGDGKVVGGRRRSLDGGGVSGQMAASLRNGNVSSNLNGMNGTHGTNGTSGSSPDRKPELSVFDGYFQQQQRRYDGFDQQGSAW